MWQRPPQHFKVIILQFKKYRETDRQVEGTGETSLCGAYLWRERDALETAVMAEAMSESVRA